ncbi:MAG: hypothetical protein Q9193_004760 [Seirophora villosa]
MPHSLCVLCYKVPEADPHHHHGHGFHARLCHGHDNPLLLRRGHRDIHRHGHDTRCHLRAPHDNHHARVHLHDCLPALGDHVPDALR